MLDSMISSRPLTVSFAILALAVLSLPGCKAPKAFGERDSIIVRADAALWDEVGSDVMAALEPTAVTTRPERIFTVTFVAADDTLWRDLRLWQQVVLIGTSEDAIVADLAAKSDAPVEPPAIVSVRGVWARDQIIFVVLLPLDRQAEALRETLPALYENLDAHYEEWILQRMYTTGVNDSLKGALAVSGFTMDVPRVYLHDHEDSLFRFANPYRQGDTDLIRSILLTWIDGTGEQTPESLLQWRERIDETEYEPPQDILPKAIRFDSVQVGDLMGLEVRGVWQDRSNFPAAGPFITRAIACPRQNRTYLMDATLFAPGKDKYPYVRQLEIILDSFRCTG